MTTGGGTPIDAIQLGVVWQRLNSILDEAAQTFVRTAFSTVVRENWDFGFGLMAADGRLFAQSSRSVPSFIGTMPVTLRVMRDAHGDEPWREGDVLITNDPWHCTGHLNDITLIRPMFHGGRCIGYVGGISHTVDIGGATSPQARDLFEEGLCIPVSHIVRAGEENGDVIRFLAANVRSPTETLGDLRAQIASMNETARRIRTLLGDVGIGDLDHVSAEVLERSERRMRGLIEAVPDGTYRSSIVADGYDEPLTIRVAVTIAGDEVAIDYEGTVEQVEKPINSVMNFTRSYSCYTIRSILDPATPNNDGSYAPITVTAPEGSLVNPLRPAPVWARHLTGHYFPPVIMSALADVLPERVMADSGSPLWATYLRGVRDDKSRFAKIFFMNGGHGARPDSDGPACLSFPSNVSNTPLEEFENELPIVVREKALISDSGGAGANRGGLGQRITMEVRSERPVLFSYRNERVHHPPRGFLGGEHGSPGRHLVNGAVVNPKAQASLGQGDTFTFELPSGGGMFPAWRRPIATVVEDVLNGDVTLASARDSYAVVIDASGSVDQAATERLRTDHATGSEVQR